MGTVWKRLDPVTINALRKPGYYADGGGLYLQIAKGGSKSWVLRYGRMGRRREMGLGGYPATTLKQARDRASECRAQLWAGKDPIAERRATLAAEKGAMSFRETAEAYVTAHAPSWRNAKHAQQWQTSLATYAYPVFGDLPLQALEPIWTVKTETASRVRQRIEAVLDWATARRYRTGENPARWRGHLDKLLAKPSRVRSVTHFAALPYADLPQLMLELRQKEGVAARALEFCILTAARTGEVIGAQWGEIESKVWTTPAERTKARRSHRVPLSAAVLSLLESLPKASTFVFPGGRTTTPLSPQDSVNAFRPLPADCDVVIVILWSRMGTPTPLPERKPDDTPFTGTEWEYHNAISSSRKPRPQVLVYLRTQSPPIDPGDHRREEKENQYQAVRSFIEGVRVQQRGTNDYFDVADFESKIEHLLQEYLWSALKYRGDGRSVLQLPPAEEMEH